MKVAELREWLLPREAPTKGKKSDMLERYSIIKDKYLCFVLKVRAYMKYRWDSKGCSSTAQSVNFEISSKLSYPEQGWMAVFNMLQFNMSQFVTYFVKHSLNDNLPVCEQISRKCI